MAGINVDWDQVNMKPDRGVEKLRANRRRRLWQASAFMGCTLAGVFLYVFLSGLMPGSTGRGTPGLEDGVAAGAVVLRRMSEGPVWVIGISAGDEGAEDVIAPHVNGGVSTPCHPGRDEFCYFSARSRNPDLVLRYVSDRPPQLARNIPWYGGFVDPADGAVFDRFGRGYLVNGVDAKPHLDSVTEPSAGNAR